MPKTLYIYTLTDPFTNEIRYVGKTNNPRRRQGAHVSGAKTGKTYVQRWIKKVCQKGKEPIMTIIEETTPDEWQDRERYWIQHYKDTGAPLTNTSEGGKGGSGPHTEEAKRKISRGRKGMKFTEEHKERLRQRKAKLYNSKRGQELIEQYSRDYGKLSDEQVVEIWLLAHQGISHVNIAKMYNTPDSTVSEISTNKRYKHVTRPEFPLFEGLDIDKEK